MPKIYDDLKSTILVHANDIVVAGGYQKLNIRDVATACGIAVGTIYNYFPTKNALISELMYAYWMDFIADVLKIQARPLDFFEKLRKIYELLVSFIDNFKETWLKLSKNEKGMTPDHHRQKDQIDHLITDTVEAEIIKFRSVSSIPADTAISDRDLAAFIVQNIMMFAQAKQLDYNTFEHILKYYFR